MARCTSTKRTRIGVQKRLEGRHQMCAYWHRSGGSGRSKVVSLVNLVLSSALLGDRTDPRATGGGDAQTVHSAARHVSGYPCADGSTDARSTNCPDARPD